MTIRDKKGRFVSKQQAALGGDYYVYYGDIKEKYNPNKKYDPDKKYDDTPKSKKTIKQRYKYIADRDLQKAADYFNSLSEQEKEIILGKIKADEVKQPDKKVVMVTIDAGELEKYIAETEAVNSTLVENEKVLSDEQIYKVRQRNKLTEHQQRQIIDIIDNANKVIQEVILKSSGVVGREFSKNLNTDINNVNARLSAISKIFGLKDFNSNSDLDRISTVIKGMLTSVGDEKENAIRFADKYVVYVSSKYKEEFLENFEQHLSKKEYLGLKKALSGIDDLDFLAYLKRQNASYLSYALDSFDNEIGRQIIRQFINDIKDEFNE